MAADTRTARQTVPAVRDRTPWRTPAIGARFTRDRAVHPYGLADVQQLWNVSRWWVVGEAAVGVMHLPGSPVPVLYAVSARDAEGTLELLERLAVAGRLPPRFVVTGPRGLTERLTRSGQRRALGSGDFFHPDLLATGGYLGLYAKPPTAGAMVATAGIHVIDPVNRVAAIGNVATHPDHRARGLARHVTSTLCHRLLTEVDVVGLNVTPGNLPARRLYDRLGLVEVLAYEEAELSIVR